MHCIVLYSVPVRVYHGRVQQCNSTYLPEVFWLQTNMHYSKHDFLTPIKDEWQSDVFVHTVTQRFIFFLACLYCGCITNKTGVTTCNWESIYRTKVTHNHSHHGMKQTIKHSVEVEYKNLSAYNFKDGYWNISLESKIITTLGVGLH